MIIKQTPQFELRANVHQYGPDAYSVELFQHWPQAQRPEWRRLCQLNLTREEAAVLAVAIYQGTRDAHH